MERQKQLRQVSSDTAQDAQRAQEGNKVLATQRDALDDQIAQYDLRMVKLLEERATLRSQIAALRQNKQLGEDKLEALQTLYRNVQASDTDMSADYGRLSQAQEKKQYLDSFSAQNQRMTDEILLLLGQ